MTRLTPEDKAREAALRRRAERHGLVLRRNRARAADAPGYGLWQLGTISTRGRFHPDTGWLDLDGIEEALTS
jgi:hypothetical protein